MATPGYTPEMRREWVKRPPSLYTVSLASRTNSTMSNIPGVGRVLGNIMKSAGNRIEPVMSRAAEGLGFGPNAVAQRIIDLLIDEHSLAYSCVPNYLKRVRIRQSDLHFLVSRAWSSCPNPECGHTLSFHRTDPGYRQLLQRLLEFLRY